MTNFGMQIQAWDWKTPATEINDWVVEMSRKNPNLKFYPIETHNDEYAIAYTEQEVSLEDVQNLYNTTEEEKGLDEYHDEKSNEVPEDLPY